MPASGTSGKRYPKASDALHAHLFGSVGTLETPSNDNSGEVDQESYLVSVRREACGVSNRAGGNVEL